MLLDTSFTGLDTLRTRLRSGNFGGSVFGTGLTTLETAYSSKNSLQVDRLFYSFPIGSSFTVVGGPVVRQDDMLAVWPSNYPVDTILDFFTYAGAPGAYNLSLGSGAGIAWTKNGWSFSANYLSTNGNSSDPLFLLLLLDLRLNQKSNVVASQLTVLVPMVLFKLVTIMMVGV